MNSINERVQKWIAKTSGLPNGPLFFIIFAVVVISHLTLLKLPYYWDEGGYYIPAALDFYHRHTLIPEFTNAHPPLPNVLIGSLWHIFGYHILVTRLAVCSFAAGALLAVFRLAEVFVGTEGALTTTLLTAVYPIWFTQSTLAHADIFAAAFTLAAFALYLPAQVRNTDNVSSHNSHRLAIAALFSFAALSKETAIIQPAALASVHVWLLLRGNNSRQKRTAHVRWLTTLSFPVLPLGAWYVYHRIATGFTFGNPEYLRYNATANFTIGHVLTALRYRFLHLAWQRNIWFAIVLALTCLLFVSKSKRSELMLPASTTVLIALLLVVNLAAFSLLGGALLTRYLLPIYPLILLLCVAVWRARTVRWPMLAALTFAAFLAGLWWSPPAAYAPEDSLTYRDMIVVHQQAIAFLDKHFANARVLTSWPAAGELSRPELGYTDRKIMGPEIDNFTSTAIDKAAHEQDQFDTALVFSKNFTPPMLARYLMSHPGTKRGHDYAEHRDLSANEIAQRLGGEVVFYAEQGGEWAAVLRFPRRYNAQVGMRTANSG